MLLQIVFKPLQETPASYPYETQIAEDAGAEPVSPPHAADQDAIDLDATDPGPGSAPASAATLFSRCLSQSRVAACMSLMQ